MAGYEFSEKSGVGRIGAERLRQVLEKGWTVEHDRTEHGDGALLDFATALLLEYLDYPRYAEDRAGESASWVSGAFEHARDKYRGRDRYRLLEIAGALIAAELDRISGGAS